MKDRRRTCAKTTEVMAERMAIEVNMVRE
jgi:hypothetical protein